METSFTGYRNLSKNGEFTIEELIKYLSCLCEHHSMLIVLCTFITVTNLSLIVGSLNSKNN
jgi:hypothetical protein